MRGRLKLARKALQDVEVQALWLAIDADGSGFLCAKDFAKFMAIGRPERGSDTSAGKERLVRQKSAAGAEVRAKLQQAKYE